MIQCPKCGAQESEQAPAEVLHLVFYPHRDAGYYTCIKCTRRFHNESQTFCA